VVHGFNAYFVKDHTTCINIFIDNIFVELRARILQQTVGIPMGTNCAPLLADFLSTHMKLSLSMNFFVKEKEISTVL